MKATKVKDVISLYSSALIGVYGEQEARSITFYALHHVLGFSKTDVVMRKEEAIDDKKYAELIAILDQLKQDVPIQYIIGETEFYGLPFTVNNNVLIPRPETEELVAWVLEDKRAETPAILDIGTGSGCIAITLKKNIPESAVVAVDISTGALTVAKHNATLNGVTIQFSRLDILQAEQWQSLPVFDVIVSNPPYVRELEKAMMKENVLKHEPSNALFVPDQDPLMFYAAIVEFSKTHLHPHGVLYLEINEYLSDALVEMIKSNGYASVVVKKDMHGKSRMIRCSVNS